MSSVSRVIGPLRAEGSSRTSAASGCGSPAVSARRAHPPPCRGPSCAAPRSAPPGCRASRRGAGRASRRPRRALRSRRRSFAQPIEGAETPGAANSTPRPGPAHPVRSRRGSRPGRARGSRSARRSRGPRPRTAARRTRAPAATSRSAGASPSASAPSAAAAACRMQLDNRDHAVFYGLWAGSPSGAASACCRSTPSTTRFGGVPPRACLSSSGTQTQRACLLFLAEQFLEARGMEVTDEMRVAIAAQACLPIPSSGSTGTAAGPASWSIPEISRAAQRARRGRRVHEWDDELAGEAMPGAGRDLVDAAARHAHQRRDPRVRAQARHGGRRRRRHAAAASGMDRRA